MDALFLDRPDPNFDELLNVLRGEHIPRRVYLVEESMDTEIMAALSQLAPEYDWEPWENWKDSELQPGYYHNLVQLHYRLGYDTATIIPIWEEHPKYRRRLTGDTATHRRAQREWVDEKQGLISNWKDFEEFPWDDIRGDTRSCEFAAQSLPEGMKLAVEASLFEHVLENLLGYEGLFFMSVENPQLVSQTFERWGEIVYQYYASVIESDAVGAIFHADDLGFNTSTFLSPHMLRQFVFPWFKKYADLAHSSGKPFWLHSCGNVFKNGVMDTLIDEIGIDAFHSHQDIILPVGDFIARYGKRVATLGGIDMDVLARLEIPAVRAYVNRTLTQCMPYGRFALGAANSVANYIPIENYSVMIEVARRWKK